MHMFYYLKRMRSGEELVGQGMDMLDSIKEQHPAIYQVAQKVSALIAQFYGIETNDDELVYLMIHMNRLYEKNVRSNEDE